jgi:GAF domain-containing protein
LRIKWGDGIVGHVASTLRTLNIPDAYQDSRFNKEVDRKTGFVTRAILTVPITDWEGKCVGVFQAVNKKTGNPVFGPEDEANLTHLATTYVLSSVP